MFSLNKVMTHKEAECFRALRRWQRADLKQRLLQSLFPKPAFLTTLSLSSMIGRVLLLLVIVLLSPLLAVLWFLKALHAILLFPIMLASTYFKPPGLRAPGERNIKGVHYQFAKHIDLPPELYIRCLDDWVSILYGPDKLPKYSITSYLDADYLLRREVAYDEDAELKSLLKTQISNAREDLSRDLGHY